MQECNDAGKNDSSETLDEETMAGLKEMGAFGLQVLYHAPQIRVACNTL